MRCWRERLLSESRRSGLAPPESPQLLQPRGQVPSRVAPVPRAGTPTPRLRGLTASARSGAGSTVPGHTPSRG
jgi:hypothetical protein